MAIEFVTEGWSLGFLALFFYQLLHAAAEGARVLESVRLCLQSHSIIVLEHLGKRNKCPF